MENINNFKNAARGLGVPECSMFNFEDLYEEKNLGSVVNCIYILGGVVQAKVPEFSGPKLGVPVTASSRDRKRDIGKITDGSCGYSEVLERERPKDYCSPVRDPASLKP